MDRPISGEKPQRLVEDEAVPEIEDPIDGAGSYGDAPLSKLATIMAAKDVVESVDVPCPEWGVTVQIRGLTRGEVQRAMKAAGGDSPDSELVNAHSMAAAMIDPPVTLKVAQELLDKKSMAPTARITKAIMEASGMGEGFLQE